MIKINPKILFNPKKPQKPWIKNNPRLDTIRKLKNMKSQSIIYVDISEEIETYLHDNRQLWRCYLWENKNNLNYILEDYQRTYSNIKMNTISEAAKNLWKYQYLNFKTP